MLVLLGSLLNAPSVHAQKNALGTIADFHNGTGGSAKQIATSGSARWVKLCAPATNSASVIRVGDSNVSSTRGTMIAKVNTFGCLTLKPIQAAPGGSPTDVLYQLSTIYVYSSYTDVIQITYGN